jgi:hypothetical protein
VAQSLVPGGSRLRVDSDILRSWNEDESTSRASKGKSLAADETVLVLSALIGVDRR